MKKNWQIWSFVLLIVIVPVSVFGIVKLAEQCFQPLPVLGEEGHRIQPFSLTNQQGEKVSLQTWQGKIVVVNYFFTHCTSICPKMMYQLKRVQAYANIPNLQIASFTVDPERDSAQRLHSYADQMAINGAWQLLTGDKPQLYRLARKSFLVVATDGDGGPEDFIHSDKLVLIDAQQRIRGFYDGTSEIEVSQLIKDIQKLNSERKG